MFSQLFTEVGRKKGIMHDSRTVAGLVGNLGCRHDFELLFVLNYAVHRQELQTRGKHRTWTASWQILFDIVIIYHKLQSPKYVYNLSCFQLLSIV